MRILRCVLVVGLATAQPALAMDAKAAFERLKALSGEWQGNVTTKDGPPAQVTYRVASNGNVVMEDLFPGTSHNMISMYHLDGGELMITHYCALGNRPTLKLATAQASPGEMRFEFAGGTGFKPESDIHVHSGRIVFVDADHIEAEWAVYAAGQQAGSNKFFLARKE